MRIKGHLVAAAWTLFASLALAVPLPPTVLESLKTATPGTTVDLPEGEFDIRELTVGQGVKLRGAGYALTTLNAKAMNGLTLKNAAGAGVSDLSIRGAAGCNLLIEDSTGVSVSRVRLLGGLSGLQAVKCAGLRVECVVAVGNRTGILLNNCDSAVVVNSTLVQANSACLSVVGGKGTRVFNNVFSSSPLGVIVGEQTQDLRLDYNLYQVSRIGKWKDTPPFTVWSWRDQTGYDAHSAQLTAEFEDEDAGHCRPLTPLAWAPGLPVTGLWGVKELAGAQAPATDIAGLPLTPFHPAWKNLAPVNVGAFNARGREESPDGTFAIESDDGLKSAGLYTPDGKLAAWLFQTLPLRKGVYPYWLPTRDWQNRPLPAGNYELRMTEADLRLKPVGNGLAGTTATSAERSEHGAIQAQQPLFDSQGRLVYSMGWSESVLNVRAFDAAFSRQRWAFVGSEWHVGFAADGRGSIYSMRRGATKTEYSLLKLDEESGSTREFQPGIYILYFKEGFSETVNGMTVLGDTLFVADTGTDKILVGDANAPDFKQGFAVTKPSSPCADTKRNLIWVVSDNSRILVLNPADGTVKYDIAAPVEKLHSIAVNGDRLAAVSYATGKVHLFDIADPAKPKELSAFSSGFGEYDKFLFKGGKAADDKLCRVALRVDGAVAVVDNNGVKLFSADGKLTRELTGGWYQYLYLGESDPVKGQEVIDASVGGRAWWLNAKAGTAVPGRPTSPGFASIFRRDGVTFGLANRELSVAGKPSQRQVYCLSRIDPDGKYVPVLGFRYEGHPISEVSLLARFPDGKMPTTFVEADWQPAPAGTGKVVRIFNGSEFSLAANGDLLIDGGARLAKVPLKKISAEGIPEYDWARIASSSRKMDDFPETKLSFSPDGTIVSPHDRRTIEKPIVGRRLLRFLSDGSVMRGVSLKTGRAAALTGNWGTTDCALFDATGNLRWFLPLPEVNSAIGPYVVDDVIYLCSVVGSETQIVDKDGLILGRCGQPEGVPWGGKWLDNGLQFVAFKGNDGKPYVIYGSFNDCCLYWFAMDGLDKVRKTVQKVSLTRDQSTRLASLPVPAPVTAAQPSPTRITIKRTKEMAMDGDLKKWRTLLPIPQVIATPDAGKDNKGPTDCSAVLRFAHDGANLYVQCIKFDDRAVMFQPSFLFYRQDGLEMAINSFAKGFKFNVTRVSDKGDIVLRDRFQFTSKYLDPAKAPRRIDVLESAATVTERKFIEDVYGVDLSKSPVIVTEFTVPLDDDTYEGDLKAKPGMSPGATLWLGLLINDNDMPGSDVQNAMAWPSTYGTFNSKESGALATFE